MVTKTKENQKAAKKTAVKKRADAPKKTAVKKTPIKTKDTRTTKAKNKDVKKTDEKRKQITRHAMDANRKAQLIYMAVIVLFLLFVILKVNEII